MVLSWQLGLNLDTASQYSIMGLTGTVSPLEHPSSAQSTFLAQPWGAEKMLALVEGCSSPCVLQEGFRGLMIGTVGRKAVQHSLGRLVRAMKVNSWTS